MAEVLDLADDEAVYDPSKLVIQETQGDQQPSSPSAEDIPEKYRGKSLTEIVRMHQEAERLIGRQGQEVGELRRLADSIIQSQMTKQTEPQAPTGEEVDFYVDPQRAVEQAIERHPAVQEAQRTTAEMRKQTALARLKQKHSDMEGIVATPAFLEWIQASPVRTKLFVQADQQFDYDAADELLSLFKERNQAATQVARAEAGARQDAVKRASTGGQRGGAEGVGKRIYRRAEIIRLMNADPEKYEAMQPEIMAAYAEGRVR